MSWILGKYSKSGIKNFNEFESFKYKYKIQNENYLVISDGIAENIIYDNKFIICGTSISNDENIRFLTHKDWTNILNLNVKNNIISNLNGHFIGIQAIENELFLFTDALGTRDIHYFEINDEVYFSSKPDFLKNFNKSNEIDFENFITRFTLSVQFNQKSVFKGLKRLTANTRIHLSKNKFEFSATPYFPKRIESSPEIIENKLEQLLLVGSKDNNKITLGLSGGMDSRLLLAILLKSKINNWDLYSFGYQDHPDVKIAKKISKEININHKIYNSDLNNIEDSNFYKLVEDFCIATSATSPTTETLQKSYYSEMHQNNLTILDGGFGEILRRGLFNRLLFSKNDIVNKNINNLHKTLKVNYPDIFNPDLKSKIEQSTKDQISETLEIMPDLNEFGFENWLDLLSIKTKLPNYTGIEQSRTDNFAKVITPYQQKVIFDLNFNLKLDYRLNSKMFKMLIENNSPILTKFPLVKGDITHPYSFNTLQSKIYTKIYKFVSSPKADENQNKVLQKLKPLIFDEMNSTFFTNNDIINSKFIKNKIVEYFTTGKDPNFVDWYLSYFIYSKYLSKHYN